jgi:multiple sugar transport system substrate-binding protein
VSHRFRALGCALALATALAACAGPEQESSGDGPTVITYWSSLRGTQAVVDAFNATHTDIQVDLDMTPSGAAGTNAKTSPPPTTSRSPASRSTERSWT